MTWRAILLCLAVVCGGLPQGAQAHEQAIGVTEITLIADNLSLCAEAECRIEVAHRLSIHDAESTLMNVLGARADLVGDPDAQARFATYVAEQFQLRDGVTAAPLALTLLGGEVERGYFWVYQEATLSQGLQSLSVENGVLMDAIPAQTNRVNIRRGGQIETLVFNQDPGPQTLQFDQVTAP